MRLRFPNWVFPGLLVALMAVHPLASAQVDVATEEAGQAGGRAALEQFAGGLERFHATFEQVVLNSDGEIQDANEGEMWLSRPSLFRWAYGGDFPEVIVADGERVWIWDVSLEQITVKDQAGLANDSPLSLLTDLSRLDEQFEVRDLGVHEGLAYVELRSVLDGAEFDRVLLGIRGQALELMAMEDAFGLRTEIRFKSSERNPDFDSSMFAFEIPDGVDVVGDIALNGGFIDETDDEEAE